jgi:hypothetical protein
MGYLSRRITPGTHGSLRRIFSGGQEDASPGVVASAAEQINHFLKRRTAERRPIGGEHTLDVSKQTAGGTIDFQGQGLRLKILGKIEASVVAEGERVKEGISRQPSAFRQQLPPVGLPLNSTQRQSSPPLFCRQALLVTKN